MSPLEKILSCLDKVRQSGRSWMACCPVHEDRSPSLRITETDDKRVLLYCLAGCGASDVVASLGLRLSDLYPTKLGNHIPGFFQQVKSEKQRREIRWAKNVLALWNEDRRMKRPVVDDDKKTLSRAREILGGGHGA